MTKEKERLARLSRKDIALEFYKCTMRELRVHKFIAYLRKKVHVHRETLRRFTTRNVSDKYLTISNNEILVGLYNHRKLKNKSSE